MSKDHFITVKGKRFHYTWLRDHCLSHHSRHPDSWEKLEDLSDRVCPPEPLSVEERNGELIIDWNETPSHRSIFPISWLLDQAYDPEPQTLTPKVRLWNKTELEANPQKLYHSCSSDPKVWSDQLLTLGFVILKDIEPENLSSFLSSIGPIRNTEYGSIVTATVGKGLSSTVKALPPHNDLTYCSGDRLVQFIYCAENKASGGESLVVDGFRVAQDFRQEYPNYFQILVETPLPFWRVQQEHQYFFQSQKTIIELDKQDNLAAIRFSQKNGMPHLPFDKIESFYEAYTAFSRSINNLDYRYCFRLQPGNCLLMQNFRILHGRAAFEPNSGSREMRVGYIDWDYFLARHLYQDLILTNRKAMNNPEISINVEKLKAEYEQKGFKCELTTTSPGEDWTSENNGHEADEIYILLEGELEFVLQGKTYRPAIGEAFRVPAYVPHTFKNPGDKISRYYWIYGYEWEDNVTGSRQK